MKKEYNIDIVDIRICSQARRGILDNNNNNKPIYSISMYGATESQLICYLIDGNDGKTLFTTTRNLRGDRKGSIIDDNIAHIMILD